MEKTRVHIRWMIRRDIPEVLGIERQVFEFPWFEEEFIRCLRQRSCIGMVAEHGERVVGFVIYELHRNKLHILNLAVHAGFQGRSIGSQIVEKLQSQLGSQRRNEISLEIRETNLGAQLFFSRMGFKATAIMPDFYDDSPEDAYSFQYQVPQCVECV